MRSQNIFSVHKIKVKVRQEPSDSVWWLLLWSKDSEDKKTGRLYEPGDLFKKTNLSAETGKRPSQERSL